MRFRVLAFDGPELERPTSLTYQSEKEVSVHEVACFKDVIRVRGNVFVVEHIHTFLKVGRVLAEVWKSFGYGRKAGRRDRLLQI